MSTVADVGEFELIDQITRRLSVSGDAEHDPEAQHTPEAQRDRDGQSGTGHRPGKPPAVELGPGDDAALLAVEGGRVVATTDLLVERRHFRRDWSSAYDVGRKAAAQNLVDVTAMGAWPRALLVGLATPGEVPVSWVLELADGFRDECALVGAQVIGGDVVGSDRLTVSVTALGALDGQRALTRSGARVGDTVAICGRLGWAAAGLTVLERGFSSPRAVVAAHRRPEPPYDAGPEAAALGATALIDISDGLIADLGHVAAASGVHIDVASGTLEVAEPLQTVGAAFGVEARGFVLNGGDDHALAATFPAGTDLPSTWRVIGHVHEAESRPGAVTIDGEEYEGPPARYDHFR